MNDPSESHVCTVCLTPIQGDDQPVACPACHAAYHEECWRDNGGCGVYGCENAPAVEPRGALEIPVAHWGQQHKTCPACGAQIMAAAVRCKQCGATFSAARLEDSVSFNQRTARESRLPAVRRGAILLFVLCAVPCTSFIGLIYGLIWYTLKRADVRALPGLYGALCKIGLILGALLSIGEVLAMFFYAVLHPH